jgi:glycosyltransferase involved in cell wall biosynthesis
LPKLWVFHSSNELYGSDLVLLEVVSGLAKQGWLVRVILPNDLAYQPLLSEKLVAAGIAVESRSLGVLRRRYQTPLGLLKLLWLLVVSVPSLAWQMRRAKVDLVYTNTGVVLSGALAAKLARTRHIWGLKEYLPPGKIRLLLARLYSWLSVYITVTSEAVRGNLGSAYAPAATKAKIIPNSVDIERFQPNLDLRKQTRQRFGIAEEVPVIGMLGRVAQTKGPEVLLEAAKLLQPHFPQACFLIIGGPVPGEEWYLEGLKAKVQALGLGEVVHFIDFQPEVVPLFNALNIVVVPSLRPEGFGLTVIQGMASGCAVVASAQGGPLETIHAEVTGLLYEPPASADALASSLTRLLEDAEFCQRLGAQGRAVAVAKFSRSHELEAYRLLFVLAEKQG